MTAGTRLGPYEIVAAIGAGGAPAAGARRPVAGELDGGASDSSCAPAYCRALAREGTAGAVPVHDRSRATVAEDPPPVVRLTLPLPDGLRFSDNAPIAPSPALSPDGRYLALLLVKGSELPVIIRSIRSSRSTF